jgi:nitrogen regulatory protein P-II 1
MKMIRCIVHPGKLDEIVTALQPVTSGMTAREIRSCGPGEGWHSVYRGVEYETLLPRILLDIVSDETWVDDIIRIVVATARTGESLNDGSVQIIPVEESYHVRTGFMDI